MSAETAIIRGRAVAEAQMIDECIIRRGDGEPTFDDTTGEYVAGSTVVYQGKCQVKPEGGFEIESGGTEIIKHRILVKVPVAGSVGVRPDDQVEVTIATLDPDLAGAMLAVVETPTGTYLSARRLVCELLR